MSGAGAAPVDLAGAHGMRVAVVAATWHETVMAGLVEGACAVCAEAGATVAVHRVPGSFELPIVAAELARTGVDAVVALGVIIRGGTPHFEYVSQATTSGLTRVALDTRVPVGFGVLTCDTEEQALDRSGLPGSSESKGREAAAAAIATAVRLREIRALQ